MLGITRPSWNAQRTATLGVGVVALTAAVVSFTHVQEVTRRAGESELAAWLLPFSLDGAIGAAAAVILADSRKQRRTYWLTWVLLALGMAASLAVNVAAAQPTVLARLVAAWPPVALALGVEVLASLSRQDRPDRAASVQTGPQTAPDRATGPDRAASVQTGPQTAPDRATGPDRAASVQTGPQTAPDRAGLHLVDQAAVRQLDDAAAVERIRELDRRNGGPVSRSVVIEALGCGASRATRLAGLARDPKQSKAAV